MSQPQSHLPARLLAAALEGKPIAIGELATLTPAQIETAARELYAAHGKTPSGDVETALRRLAEISREMLAAVRDEPVGEENDDQIHD